MGVKYHCFVIHIPWDGISSENLEKVDFGEKWNALLLSVLMEVIKWRNVCTLLRMDHFILQRDTFVGHRRYPVSPCRNFLAVCTAHSNIVRKWQNKFLQDSRRWPGAAIRAMYINMYELVHLLVTDRSSSQRRLACDVYNRWLLQYDWYIPS